MANSNRVLVNLQVDDGQRERWKAYADDSPEHDSLSQLIRFAVEREIGSSNTTQGNDGLGDGASEQLAELREENRQLRAKIDGLAESVERIDDRLAEPSGEIRELASDIFEVLPARDLVVDEQGNPRLSHGFGLPDDQNKVYDGTPEAVAENMGIDNYQALRALDLLERDMSMVEKGTVYDDGVTRYYLDESHYERSQ